MRIQIHFVDSINKPVNIIHHLKLHEEKSGLDSHSQVAYPSSSANIGRRRGGDSRVGQSVLRERRTEAGGLHALTTSRTGARPKSTRSSNGHRATTHKNNRRADATESLRMPTIPATTTTTTTAGITTNTNATTLQSWPERAEYEHDKPRMES